MEPQSKDNRTGGEGTGALLAQKASASLKRREASVIREWLTAVIDDLGISSLECFPVRELTTEFPELIDHVATRIAGSQVSLDGGFDIDAAAGRLATLRREKPDLKKMLEDYNLLKRLLLDAATGDLRKADLEVIRLSRSLDESFNEIMRAGIEAYIEQRSLELQHLADTDALTGLYNVRYFRRQLHKHLEMYKRYRIPFALMMLDLDNLKELNDMRGHGAGDVAIRHLAAVMMLEKREIDVAVRYGGDEFFLLLPGTSTDEAERLAHRISRRVREINMETGGEEITGVSIGVVSCPADGTDVGALRAKADRALYLAKSIGGASVTRYRDFATP